MKYTPKILMLVLTFFSSVSFAVPFDARCPSILETAKISTGYTKAQWKDMAPYLTEDVAVLNVNRQIVATRQTNYKIKIEEVDSKSQTVKSELVLDCPIAKNWDVVSLPSVGFKKASVVKDIQDPELPGGPINLIRSGLRLTRLFHDSKEFFSIYILWNLFTDKSNDVTPLPTFITKENTNFSEPSLSESNHPVRAIRFSTNEKFGNVWYLVTQKAIKALKDQEMLSPIYASDALEAPLTEVTARTASLSFLEYYDSLNKKFYPCSDFLAKSKDANCLHYNYVLNPDLWDRLEKRESVKVQIILDLSEGFLVQTYSVDGEESQTPKLLNQKLVKDLTEYNLQSVIFE